MCSPAALLVGVQAGAQIAGGMYQQKAAKQAAIQARREAIYQQQVAAAESEQIRYMNQRELASIANAFGKRGVAFDSASMMAVIAESAGNLEYPALLKEHEGVLARYKGNAQAAALRTAGQNAMTQSLLGGLTTFVSAGIDTNWWKKG
jgi:hypothetical protein